MISKELLSEVLGIEVISVQVISITVHYAYKNVEDKEIIDKLNIHYVAHKCKEWARHNKFRLVGWYRIGKSKDYKIDVHNHDMCIYESSSKTEPEAIFKACQWILDNKDV